MSIRFPCPDCGQLLSAHEEKVGRRVRCPKCKIVLTVPSAEDAAQTRARREREHPEESDDNGPLFDLVVYDDAPAFTTSSSSGKRDDKQAAPIDRDRVSIPRAMIYTQGVLIATVALIAFIMGFLIGGATGPSGGDDQADSDRTPVLVKGRLQRLGPAQGPIPDEGSVMIALPANLDLGGEKLQIDGLGPADQLPPRDHQIVQAIVSRGGAYTRTNEYGAFEVRLRPGDYRLLLISRDARRGPGQPVTAPELASLGEFFEHADRLIGPFKYRWQRVRVTDGYSIEYNFDQSDT